MKFPKHSAQIFSLSLLVLLQACGTKDKAASVLGALGGGGGGSGSEESTESTSDAATSSSSTATRPAASGIGANLRASLQTLTNTNAAQVAKPELWSCKGVYQNQTAQVTGHITDFHTEMHLRIGDKGAPLALTAEDVVQDRDRTRYCQTAQLEGGETARYALELQTQMPPSTTPVHAVLTRYRGNVARLHCGAAKGVQEYDLRISMSCTTTKAAYDISLLPQSRSQGAMDLGFGKNGAEEILSADEWKNIRHRGTEVRSVKRDAAGNAYVTIAVRDPEDNKAPYPRLIRITKAGERDASFGTNGVLRLEFPSEFVELDENYEFLELAPGKNNTVFLLGRSLGRERNLFLVHFDANGKLVRTTLDRGFLPILSTSPTAKYQAKLAVSGDTVVALVLGTPHWREIEKGNIPTQQLIKADPNGVQMNFAAPFLVKEAESNRLPRDIFALPTGGYDILLSTKYARRQGFSGKAHTWTAELVSLNSFGGASGPRTIIPDPFPSDSENKVDILAVGKDRSYYLTVMGSGADYSADVKYFRTLPSGLLDTNYQGPNRDEMRRRYLRLSPLESVAVTEGGKLAFPSKWKPERVFRDQSALVFLDEQGKPSTIGKFSLSQREQGINEYSGGEKSHTWRDDKGRLLHLRLHESASGSSLMLMRMHAN